MRTRGKPRGFTLAELVLALAITTVIGLAVTAVAAAVSQINQEAEAYYEYLQNGRVAASRIEKALRSALLVTAASDDEFVVWMKDENDDGEINVSEVARVYLDDGDHKLLMQTTEFPDDMKKGQRQALDVDLELDGLTEVENLDLGTGHAAHDVLRLLARNVESFHVYPDVEPPMTRLLKFTLVVGENGQTVTQYGAVTLRAPRIDRVRQQDGQYLLLDGDDGDE